MTTYDFDEIIRREKTGAVKYDRRRQMFGTDDILPLWIADMDFRAPDFIVEAIRERTAHEVYGYAFVPESFYASVQAWIRKRHGWDIDRTWMLYCPGVVPSLAAAVLANTAPGEAVIVQSPVYFPFFDVIRDNGRVVVNNPLELRDGRLSMNFDHLVRCLDEKAKLFFLCSPHNPGGTVWRKEELEGLGEVCRKNGTVIVSDEIHSDLIFSGHHHIPAASISGDMSDGAITLMSPGKTFNISGLTSSVAIIPNPDLRLRFLKTLQRLHWTVPNVFSIAVFEAAYRHGEEWLKQLMAYLENNLDFLLDFFQTEIPPIRIIRPQGTYLVWLDCRALGLSGDELKAWMIRRARVGLSDGALFGSGGEGFQRLNIACPLSVLSEALERIRQAVSRRGRDFSRNGLE